jgi:hypothetical protein
MFSQMHLTGHSRLWNVQKYLTRAGSNATENMLATSSVKKVVHTLKLLSAVGAALSNFVTPRYHEKLNFV